MDVYSYIAYNNADAANDLCNQYGYHSISSLDHLAHTLQSIVALKGEAALKDVMELHPDKDVILEIFEKKNEVIAVPQQPEPQKDCSCMKSADGTSSNNNSTIASNTNLMILAAAFIVSISIISMKK
jgi:hypothetical protein